MEEKKRFDRHSYYPSRYIDNETNKIINIKDTLNQQDKRIKELEEQEKWNFDYREQCRLEEYQRWADKEITKLHKENQELKQSQKELAINELNDILKFIVTGSSNYYKPPFEIKKYIEDKINRLES